MNKINIAGVDEAGRGPLAGPVYAAAVILQKDHGIIGLNDSKKLTPKKREALYNEIKNKAISIGIGHVGVELIDKINIRNATFMAMEKAIANLKIKPDLVLIDGEVIPNSMLPSEGIVKGDTKIEEIMAASIIAKVARDKIMVNYSIIFPEYGFEKHKGYGTKLHMEALRMNMATPIHRKSFNPVSKYLPRLYWLKENNKLGWMAQKLCAMYLQEFDYTIGALDVLINNKLSIDLIAKKNEKLIFVFLNVINDSTYNENLNTIIKNDQSIKQALSNYIVYNDIQNEEAWRIDIINVDLFNKVSKFEHFEGILNNN